MYYVTQACVLYKMRSKPAWRGFFESYVIVKWGMGNLRPRLSHILVSEVGLTIKRKKCQFAMDSCVYLGHMYTWVTWWDTWVTCILGSHGGILGSHVYLRHMVGYLGHMYTCVTCTLGSHVYLRHMYTWVTCILASHVYLGHMYTWVTWWDTWVTWWDTWDISVKKTVTTGGAVFHHRQGMPHYLAGN